MNKTKRKATSFRNSDFSRRRGEFAAALHPNSAAIIVSNPERVRSNDTEFPFRQSSDFMYLSDFPEPESVLVITNLRGYPQSVLIVRKKDKSAEKWTGIREGIEGAVENFGVSAAYENTEFESVIEDILGRCENVYYKYGINPAFDARFEKVWRENTVALHDPTEILSEMRQIKSERELDVMRYSAEVSAAAHVEAMSLCQPGMHEYQLQATVEAVFAFNGCRAPAYGTIVGGGKNATILHYITNGDVLQDGDLVLIDAGSEYLGYAADITRTFPVNGKFSDAQLEIYNLVLAAQEAAIKAAKPGKTLNQIHEIAANRMRRGLVELGILPESMKNKSGARKTLAQAKKEGTLDSMAHLRRFFMHGTSHWLGLDVHDVPHDRSSRDEPLAPGMVFTVEPGLYFDFDDETVPAQYRGIGIRIEDDVVITEDGCEVLTASVPKKAAEIEKLMAEAQARWIKE